MTISILIATKDRPNDITRCLTSVLQSTFHNYEVIVVDQSHDQKTQEAIGAFQNSTIRYISCRGRGKSHALNIGIQHAQGTILAITDDDCVVSTRWISAMRQSFERFPKISAVFGMTLPYEAHQHKGQTCPCTFAKNKQIIISQPCVHYAHIGFGNNMAIRKKTLDDVGGFKTWLGPGSIGSNAEDAEMALRLLIKGHKILYTPQVVVYHNKWLSGNDKRTQFLSYSCGEMACYGYFYFQKHSFAAPVVRNNIRDSYFKLKRFMKQLLTFHWTKKLWKNAAHEVIEAFYRAWGLLIARYFSFVDPVR